MNYKRYEDWVRVSFRWVRDPERDEGLPHHIQMLGIEDAELRDIRKPDLYDDQGHPLQDKFGILLLERWQVRAHLWVLGAYELIRMLSQRVREDPALTTEKAANKIRESKRLFERVRVPLAKLEPSRKNRLTDFSVPYAGIGSEGLAWRVADNVIISQKQLSDALWDTLVSIRPREHKSQIQPTVVS
ncbi:MAG: hypothetical protein ACYC9J_13945 [Sulfuricaulis sp.]